MIPKSGYRFSEEIMLQQKTHDPAAGLTIRRQSSAQCAGARAALASGASGQRGDSIVRAHSASEDARKRADDTRLNQARWRARAMAAAA